MASHAAGERVPSLAGICRPRLIPPVIRCGSRRSYPSPGCTPRAVHRSLYPIYPDVDTGGVAYVAVGRVLPHRRTVRLVRCRPGMGRDGLARMDGGSGAMHAVSPAMIKAVQKSIEVPVVIGGGVNTLEKAQSALDAGADVLVVGNEIERNPEF